MCDVRIARESPQFTTVTRSPHTMAAVAGVRQAGEEGDIEIKIKTKIKLKF